MVIKKYILNNIVKLDKLYNTYPNEATYYSKLSIIELCGWIELSMDKIVEHFANKHLKTQPYKDMFNSLKDKNYGFDYKANFRKMLCKTIGMHKMEILEIKLNKNGDITKLDGILCSLKTLRNDAAHTYIDVTKTYQAPSVTISQLNDIYSILKHFSREIKNIK